MPIFRVHKNKEHPYTVIDNTSINDKRLGAKAKGILTFLISKPDHWYTNYPNLVSSFTDGTCSIRSGIKELIKFGYIIRTQVRKDDGKFDYYDYAVFEQPSKQDISASIVSPKCEKRISGKRISGNRTLVNTDKFLNTEIKINTTSTGGSSENDADGDLLIKKQRDAVISLFYDLNIISHKKIISSYPLKDIFNTCLWMRDVHQKIDNPTGFLITALKEKWLDIPDETPEHIGDRLHWYKCPQCNKIAGYYNEIKNFTICFKCKNKE